MYSEEYRRVQEEAARSHAEAERQRQEDDERRRRELSTSPDHPTKDIRDRRYLS